MFNELTLWSRLRCAIGWHRLPAWGPVEGQDPPANLPEIVLQERYNCDIQQRACMDCKANFWREA